MKNREVYIDVAKGLLVLFVIFYHSSSHPVKYWGATNQLFSDVVGWCHYIMQPYKMAAFFIIHGMFSHFDRPFETLMKNEALKLIIPMYILLMGLSNWFCWAMLWADVIYWALNRLMKNKLYILVLSLGISYLAIVANDLTTGYLNELIKRDSFLFGLAFVVFIAIGDYFSYLMKGQHKNKICLIGSIVYIVGAIGYYLQGVYPPELNGSAFEVTYRTYPIFLVMATSGTLLLFAVSKIVVSIKIQKLFEYVGFNSLVFYLAGFCIMSAISTHAVPYITQSDGLMGQSVFCLVLLFILITVLCWIENLILNTKWLKWIIGKY